ncbi:MAG: PepSY-like domain-containing protein [Bacteroidia bacterium]|nr:PepSY-like domain-containing protein [Bacteroidia bacterium]
MKTAAAFFFYFTLIATLSAQQTDIPQAAEKALSQRYPKAEAVIWDVTEEGEYVATFMLTQTEISARYNAKGVWLGSILYLEHESVPEAVHRAVARQFPDYEMYDVTKVELPSAEGYYEAILESESEALIVRFSAAGKVLLKELIEMDLE